ncbi:GNAT family N-acetyltransferase [Lactococcus termiticola]|uniref:GNAT family acetyltransferase n=1 Tax=Lactococcus termiticola TaxID=2169526 RepID=A0A2R5HFS7_9LACT|nr:N-acetyltransferase [Lactococcus termiticola]GBG96907.1 GNAT family acetyltransferase [Lactococcus termiticola]
MQIRDIQPKDFADVADFENENWTGIATPVIMSSTAEQIMNKILREGRDYYLAVNDDDNQILGILDAGLRHPILASRHVMTFGLIVAEDFREQGIAKALLKHFLEIARKEGFQKISMEVLAGNEPAISLYESFGFVLEGRQKKEFKIEGRYVDNLLYAYFL